MARVSLRRILHNQLFSLLILTYFLTTNVVESMLTPRATRTREIISLDGIWNFRLADVEGQLKGITEEWYKKDLSQTGDVMDMPVPSSYNDISTSSKVRDHVGLVWYDRRFELADHFIESVLKNNRRIFLRFGSVHYATQVWVNGLLAMNHQFGHLPFEAEITNLLHHDGSSNLLTVAVDNTLDTNSIPQGALQRVPSDNGTAIVQMYTFDFFNYAGIHRSVLLYTVPEIYIKDITVTTDIEGDTGIVNYEVLLEHWINFTASDNSYKVILFEKDGKSIATESEELYVTENPMKGSLRVPLARLWWPRMMHPDPGYLYRMEVRVFQVGPKSLTVEDAEILENDGIFIQNKNEKKPSDVYQLNVGIRTLFWNNDTFTINGRPVYMHGFGRHEDSDIRGKGLDLALAVRDHQLIDWVGGNCYRTSHYPYSEELMDMADRHGIMIIDECPAVDADIFKDTLLKNHKQSLTELIQRDKNHPSVIAWSVANEPRSHLDAADAYFNSVCKHARKLDKTRPLTAALARAYNEDKAAKHLDIVSFNRYNGWYSNPGRLDMITERVIQEAKNWRQRFNKPVLMSEYGADTYEGLHTEPAFIWSEDYQQTLLSNHFKAFDRLRNEGEWFIGEFIWNFADFKTAQTITRVGGNKKGIFTRSRQPKSAAHLLRRRYWKLSNLLYGTPLPKDLRPYEVGFANQSEPCDFDL